MADRHGLAGSWARQRDLSIGEDEKVSCLGLEGGRLAGEAEGAPGRSLPDAAIGQRQMQRPMPQRNPHGVA